VIEVLLPALFSSDHTTRAAVARVLGMFEDEQTHIVDALIPLLSDSSWLVRSGAVEALGNLLHKGQTIIIDALLPMLSDFSNAVRRNAARAFRNIIARESENEQIIAALLHATYDSDRLVRDAAASTLANAQCEIISIGARLEELLQQCEHDEMSSSSIFTALRNIAEKTGSV
jgi:HEAT repeat protein